MVKNLLLSFAVAVSALAMPARAATSGDATPGPVAVVDAFHAALKTGDATSALKLLSVSVSIYEQGFVDQTRADYAGAHIAADSAFAQGTELQVLERRIIWLGDNAACVVSKTSTKGNFQGHAINLVGTESMVLQRSGGSWTIEHIHWSAHPADGELKPAADEKH
ncbi:MAG: nuclear transport factor 2 family protein [Nevskia sp.]|nr:nuclear transport factor 2 family protein [Nevskia sp.]